MCCWWLKEGREKERRGLYGGLLLLSYLLIPLKKTLLLLSTLFGWIGLGRPSLAFLLGLCITLLLFLVCVNLFLG